jgi:hypothetical protein
MPGLVFTPEEDPSHLSPRRQLAPSSRYDPGRAKEAAEAWKLRRRFNPRLVGFGIVGPEPCDLRATTPVKNEPALAAADNEDPKAGK